MDIALGIVAGLLAGLAAGLAIRARQLRGQRVEIDRLARERAVLVSQVVEAEENTRSEVAQALHDDALQSLLAAHQDLIEAAPGRSGVTRAHEVVGHTIERVRAAVAALHPVVLEGAGLGPALEPICSAAERQGGFEIELTVDPEAGGDHDQLVFSIARELITLAARHSGAEHVRVEVRSDPGEIVVEVADDGGGIPPGRREAALAEGHVGLASVVQRLEAAGGRLEVETAEGEGARLVAHIPA